MFHVPTKVVRTKNTKKYAREDIEVCGKKVWQKVQDFTNGETKELFYMMSDMDTR